MKKQVQTTHAALKMFAMKVSNHLHFSLPCHSILRQSRTSDDLSLEQDYTRFIGLRTTSAHITCGSSIMASVADYVQARGRSFSNPLKNSIEGFLVQSR